MALFELNIYGNNDEILKRFETDKVRWGVYLQANELSENLKGASTAEKFQQIGAFVKKIFPDLTDADLENADSEDVLNTFTQLINKANGIRKAGSDEKNG
jgi:deoxyadenosine/deoxycytidine kinase